MTIWFDMDGTIADLYGVQNWLEMLRAEDPTPYAIAKPLTHFSLFARLIHRIQAKGVKVGIISWLSKCGTPEYNIKVTAAKMAWLVEHLPSVRWDEIKIVEYGTDKWEACGRATNDVLFDDEEKNRNNWGGHAYTPNEMLEMLKNYAR